MWLVPLKMDLHNLGKILEMINFKCVDNWEAEKHGFQKTSYAKSEKSWLSCE